MNTRVQQARGSSQPVQMVCLIRGSSHLADQRIEYLAAFDVVSASLPGDPFVAYYTPPAKFTRKSRCVQRGACPSGAQAGGCQRVHQGNHPGFLPRAGGQKLYDAQRARVPQLDSRRWASRPRSATDSAHGRRGRARRNSSTQWSARPRAQ